MEAVRADVEDGLVRIPEAAGQPADPVLALDQDRPKSGFRQPVGKGQAGDTRADDDDLAVQGRPPRPG